METAVRIEELGEFELLRRVISRSGVDQPVPGGGEVLCSIGDDAALVRLGPGRDLAVSSDLLCEGVHFRRDWATPEQIGWKALAVNVSDLGAMGAQPLAAVVGIALPAGLPVDWVRRLYSGMGEAARHYSCPVVGGDTVRAAGEAVTISVSAFGTLLAGARGLRSGAAKGDLVWVTGVVGESAAGMALLERGRTWSDDAGFSSLVEWHLRPRPPVSAGALLCRDTLCTSLMDLSDGLASDLLRIYEQSGVGARLDVSRLPISAAARRAAHELGEDPLAWALQGGEDYQLVFTTRPGEAAHVPRLLAEVGVAATRIGVMQLGPPRVRMSNGRSVRLRPSGFQHFASTGNSEPRPGVSDSR